MDGTRWARGRGLREKERSRGGGVDNTGAAEDPRHFDELDGDFAGVHACG